MRHHTWARCLCRALEEVDRGCLLRSDRLGDYGLPSLCSRRNPLHLFRANPGLVGVERCLWGSALYLTLLRHRQYATGYVALWGYGFGKGGEGTGEADQGVWLLSATENDYDDHYDDDEDIEYDEPVNAPQAEQGHHDHHHVLLGVTPLTEAERRLPWSAGQFRCALRLVVGHLRRGRLPSHGWAMMLLGTLRAVLMGFDRLDLRLEARRFRSLAARDLLAAYRAERTVPLPRGLPRTAAWLCPCMDRGVPDLSPVRLRLAQALLDLLFDESEGGLLSSGAGYLCERWPELLSWRQELALLRLHRKLHALRVRSNAHIRSDLDYRWRKAAIRAMGAEPKDVPGAEEGRAWRGPIRYSAGHPVLLLVHGLGSKSAALVKEVLQWLGAARRCVDVAMALHGPRFKALVNQEFENLLSREEDDVFRPCL